MNVQVIGTTSPALVDHVNAQIGGAITALEDRTDTITVKLEDLNGTSKGHDKRCHVTVRLRKEEPIIVEEINDDMYNAISKAANRLKNVVNRKHDKRMEKLHGH